MATQIVSPQVAPQIIPFRKPDGATPAPSPQITQADLEKVILLKREVREVQATLETAEAAIRAKLEAGVSIEEGIHLARLEPRERRNVAWKEIVVRLAKRLKLDGEAYCVNVLAHTAPTRTVALVVE